MAIRFFHILAYSGYKVFLEKIIASFLSPRRQHGNKGLGRCLKNQAASSINDKGNSPKVRWAISKIE
jgi:hypothetical protein